MNLATAGWRRHCRVIQGQYRGRVAAITPRYLPSFVRRGWIEYLTAHFCKSLLWHGSSLLFAFFLTETCAIPPGTTGMLIGLTLLVNAVADVLATRCGALCASGTAAIGRAQALGAPFGCLFFILFAATPLVPPQWRETVALATLLGFRLSYTLLDVPQSAMVALIAVPPTERSVLLAARNMASGVASLVVSAVAAFVLLVPRADAAFLYLEWASLVAASVMLSAWWLGHRVRAGPAWPVATPQAGGGGDPPFAVTLVLVAAIILAGSIFRTMQPYAAVFAGTGAGLLLWASVGAIVCQPFWAAIDRRLSRRWQPVLAGATAALAGMFFAGPIRSHPVGAAMAGLGFGIGTGGLWWMLSGAAMRHIAPAQAIGRAGLFTAMSKAVQGIAAIGLGLALDGMAYRSTLADPWSLPSLMMVAALAVIALSGVALAWAGRGVRRTASASAAA